ncbi:hypothetical protein GGI02_003596 [Coemansia sp. RSA 2322]|uniref:Uncharacterized protein n=1 Tax=Coemansia thaxteri TaxID=2663907 RepID=A0A9W8BM16_9FUNG|nr:hypothetical protein H4R26_001534 [Coemansia thaxteri]KAJ2468802.1 hypothetical protein GGI02_003596 [Coemansia sp. RSA 2322]
MIVLKRLFSPGAGLYSRCVSRRGIIPSTPVANVPWTQSEQEKLLRLINDEYRDKIDGNLDVLVQHLQNTPINQKSRWTDTEWKRVSEHIRVEYLVPDKRINWDEVGRKFGRSGNAIMQARHVQNQKEQLTEARQLESARSVSATDKKALEDAIISCRDNSHKTDGQHDLDWDAVAKHMKRPLLDTLAIALNSRLPDHTYLEPSLLLKGCNTWTKAQLHRLKMFIRNNYNIDAQVDWDIVALYMHADSVDCAEAYDMMTRTIKMRQSSAAPEAALSSRKATWTADEATQLRKAVAAAEGLTTKPNWTQIAATLGGNRTGVSCRLKWTNLISQEQALDASASWTEPEIALLETTLASAARYEGIVPKLKLLLPKKTVTQIKVRLMSTRVASYCRSMNRKARSNFPELSKLVEHDLRANQGIVDWNKIGASLGIYPSICEAMYQHRTSRALVVSQGKGYKRWTEAEVSRFKVAVDKQLATHGVIKWHVVAYLVGSRNMTQCYNKYRGIMKKSAVASSSSEAAAATAKPADATAAST